MGLCATWSNGKCFFLEHVCPSPHTSHYFTYQKFYIQNHNYSYKILQSCRTKHPCHCTFIKLSNLHLHVKNISLLVFLSLTKAAKHLTAPWVESWLEQPKPWCSTRNGGKIAQGCAESAHLMWMSMGAFVERRRCLNRQEEEHPAPLWWEITLWKWCFAPKISKPQGE